MFERLYNTIPAYVEVCNDEVYDEVCNAGIQFLTAGPC